MNKRLVSFSAVLVLALAGCGGGNPAGTGEKTDKPDAPAIQPPATTTPGQQPASPADLAKLKTDVQAAYKAVTSVKGDYDTRQTKGSEVYFAKVKMTFSKPRKLRLDIKSSSDALLNGAIVVWTGGPTLKGRKDIGFIPIKQEHKLSEKPNLRGWLYNQTDLDAAVTATVNNLDKAKLLGNSKVGGANVVMIEFKSTLPGAAIERIGIDTARKLPIYREFRETATGKPVFTLTYTNLVLNSPVPSSTYDIF